MTDDTPLRPRAEEPREHRIRANGVELAVWEWDGKDPPILFVHATSFHARCWDEVIRRVPRHRAYAVDMRGHGRSEKPDAPYEWTRFGEDIRQLTRVLALPLVLAVGHSMGGHSIVFAAAHNPDQFAALLLIDPVIGAPEIYRNSSRTPGTLPDFSAIARRRNRWSSVEEMYERFAAGGPFSNWDRQVLRDYCEWGLLRVPEVEANAESGASEYELACPPAIEAEIYARALVTDLYPLMGRVHARVRVLRAPVESGVSGFASSQTWPALASCFPRGEDIQLAHGTHFIPMESPSVIATHIVELLGQCSEQTSGTSPMARPRGCDPRSTK